jgi:hypothetical protein
VFPRRDGPNRSPTVGLVSLLLLLSITAACGHGGASRPASGEILGVLELKNADYVVAGVPGVAYVGRGEGATIQLLRLDAKSGSKTASYDSTLDQIPVAVTRSAVWALRDAAAGPELVRLDPTSLRETAAVKMPDGFASSVAANGDAVWVALSEPDRVVRVDTRSLKVDRDIALQQSPAGLAVSSSYLAVVTSGATPDDPGALLILNDDGTTRFQVPADALLQGPKIVGDQVWLGSYDSGDMQRVSASTGVATKVDLPRTDLADFLIDRDHVWITESDEHRLRRIGLESRTLEITLQKDNQLREPSGETVVGDELWVVNRFYNRITRVAL